MACRRPTDARVAPPRRLRTLLALLAVTALLAACRSVGAGPDTAPTSWTLAPGWKDAPCSDQGAGVVTGTVRSVTGAPIVEARVSTKTRPCWTETDSMGRFRLAGLPAGLTWLRAARQGFHADSTMVRHEGAELTVAFVLAPVEGLEEATLPPEFDLAMFERHCPAPREERAIWGTVTDSAGSPLESAQVWVEHDGESCGALTDASGRYALLGAPRVAVDVEAALIGYGAHRVAVPAGSSPIRLDLVLWVQPVHLHEPGWISVPTDTLP